MQHILYIPGLGDNSSLTKQRFLLSLWNKNKVIIHFFDPKWHDESETYAQKYSRLIELGSRLRPGEDDLIVIGVSAGGSLAVRYIAENETVTRAYLVCGKLKGSSKIGKPYQERAPALLESVQASESLLLDISESSSAKITVIRPLLDGIVPLEDMLVPGSKRVRLFTIGHTISIVYVLIVYLRIRL